MKGSDWDERWEARLVDGVREPSRLLTEIAAGLEPGRALDLACGAGRNAVWLAEHGWHVTAVDFSRVGLEAARALARERGVEVDWRHEDVVTWQPPLAAFDLVCVLYLQLPVGERRAALLRAVSALDRGGRLLVVGHDTLNLTHGYGGPKTPAVLYSAADVVADLSGLEIERAERVERTVAAEGGDRIAIDALVLACRADA